MINFYAYTYPNEISLVPANRGLWVKLGDTIRTPQIRMDEQGGASEREAKITVGTWKNVTTISRDYQLHAVLKKRACQNKIEASGKGTEWFKLPTTAEAHLYISELIDEVGGANTSLKTIQLRDLQKSTISQGFKNVHTGDFLEWEIYMKFDVVLGNPPYQHPTNKSKKIWAEFAEKSLKLSKNYTLMVTPNTWLEKPKARAFADFTESLKSRLIVANTKANKYFPNIGENIGWWIASSSSDSFTVDDTVYNREYNQELITNSKTLIFVHVLKDKFSKHPIVRNNKVVDFYYSTNAAIEQGKLSLTATTNYNIPVFISANKTAYTTDKHITPCYKVILNKSGYYYSNTDPKYMIVPITKYYGVGENGVGVIANSLAEANNARDIYSKKIFRFYIDAEKSSGFNSGLLDLPIVDFTRAWTDQELYSHFNLTQEEIYRIENTIKD